MLGRRADSRLFRRHRTSDPGARFRRKPIFEALEGRLLLSADLALQLVADALTGSPSQVQQDSLTLFQVLASASIPLLIVLADGGAATLRAGNDNNIWRITGPNQVSLNGEVFGNVGTLIGGENNEDMFIVEPDGALSGYLDGGPGGFDTLVIEGGSYTYANFVPSGSDSGTVELDGKVIRYQGLEPVDVVATILNPTVNATGGNDILTISGGLDLAAPITVSGNGGFETHTISQPREVLTVAAGDGDDTINFNLLFQATPVRIDGGAGNDTLDVSGRAVPMSAIRLSDGSYILTDGSSPLVELRNIENVVGADFTLQADGIPNWVEEGPGSINRNPNFASFRGLPWSGAVEAVAAHPANANIVYAGTVNGGVWRSTDGGVTWQALTDQFPSLSIGALVVSTHDNAGNPVTGATSVNNLVLYAGTGQFSNFYIGG